MIERDVRVDELFARLLSRWSWVFAAAVAGGLLGLLVSFARPALYEANASLGIGIDYGRTHTLELNAERSALLQVQAMLLDDAVLIEALERAGGDVEGAAQFFDAEDFSGAVRIERVAGRWDLHVRARDPAVATALANAWAHVGVEHLQRAVEYALRAQELQTLLYEVGCELQWEPEVEVAVWRCENEPIGRALEVDEIPQALTDEISKSHGVLPGTTYAILGQAAEPQEPIADGRGLLVLSGLLAGLLAGMAGAALVPKAIIRHD